MVPTGPKPVLMGPEKASRVEVAMRKFRIEPHIGKINSNCGGVTLHRLPLCFLLEAVLLKKILRPRGLIEFPWQFRSPAIVCLLNMNERAMKTTMLACVNFL